MQTPRLDSVADITMGQAPDGESYNLDGAGLPLIAGAGDFGELHPEPKKFTTAPGKTCQAGDVILGIRATIGEKVLADATYCLGRGVAGLRAKPGLDERYLWHWLSEAGPTLAAKAKGATFKQVGREDIGELRIGLPPLPEQRRIAEILDKADALRAKRRTALAQLDALTKSIFLDMFGNPATNPKGWAITRMEDVSAIVSGATPRTDTPGFWDGTIRWVTPKELSDLPGVYIQDTERRITERGLRSCGARILPVGAVLFSSRAPIGHTAVCSVPIATNQGFKSFIPKPDRLDSHYLLYWLRQRRRFLEGLGTGATFKEVSKAVVSRIEIAVPPIGLQKEFADRSNRLEALKDIERCALATTGEQFASLQYRAFRGEL